MTEVVLSLGLALVLYWVPGFVVLWGLGVRIRRGPAALLLPMLASLLVVPFLAAAVSSITHVRADLNLLIIFVSVLALAGIGARRAGWQPQLALRERVPADRRSGAWEAFAAGAFILVVAALTQLPQVDGLIHGAQSISIAWDWNWHIAELTSVARSGLPPEHYFFSDVHLAYYYWWLIYPAILANQDIVRIPLVRALAIHGLVQVIVFLSLLYWFLCANYRSKLARWLGLLFMTLAGGFDFFVTAKPGFDMNWQRDVAWLVSRNEVMDFSSLYAGTPQHVGGLMAFLLALVVWRNLRASASVRIGLLGIVASYLLGTSPYMLVSLGVAGLVWILIHWRCVVGGARRIAGLSRAGRKILGRWAGGSIAAVVGLVVLLGLASERQLLLTFKHSVHLVWNTFRVPLLEAYFGSETAKLGHLDRLLTIAGLPAVASWVLLVEIGLPVLLFIYWAASRERPGGLTWKRFLVFFPVAAFALSFIVGDSSQANNFSMNNATPALLCLQLGALQVFEGRPFSRLGLGSRIARAYVLGVVVCAQMVTSLMGLNTSSQAPLGAALGLSKPLVFANIPIANPPPHWPKELGYVLWANKNTPPSALFVEEAPYADDVRFRRLERMRYLEIRPDRPMLYMSQDEELLIPSELDLHRTRQEQGLLAAALGSAYAQTYRPEVFYVSRSGPHSDLGSPVYADEFVLIYHIGGT